MSTPYLGEIRMVSFPFAPRGWALANGQTLSVTQNQALFSLFGTAFGGNGSSTFQLPDLRGRSAMHFGNGYSVGQQMGEPTHSLVQNEIPAHTHAAYVSTGGGQHSPTNTTLPGDNGFALYDSTATATAVLTGNAVATAGFGQAHENRMPFLTINFIVALQGIYPPRS